MIAEATTSGAESPAPSGAPALITRPTYLVGAVLASAPVFDLSDREINALIKRATCTVCGGCSGAASEAKKQASEGGDQSENGEAQSVVGGAIIS